MAVTNTATLTFRPHFPNVEDGLRTAAWREHPCIANMVEVLIGTTAGAIAIPEPKAVKKS